MYCCTLGGRGPRPSDPLPVEKVLPAAMKGLTLGGHTPSSSSKDPAAKKGSKGKT